MNTTEMDEIHERSQENPGIQLSRLRESKGYSREYVAGKLHLRVGIIELLESDNYEQMPEPVFIKGYLRAYAKLLGVAPEPFLAIFNELQIPEKSLEKALWQSKRESNKAQRLIRWLTGFVTFIVIVAVSIWWQKNKDNQQVISIEHAQAEISQAKNESEIRLTDLSKMRALLPPSGDQFKATEKHGG